MLKLYIYDINLCAKGHTFGFNLLLPVFVVCSEPANEPEANIYLKD